MRSYICFRIYRTGMIKELESKADAQDDKGIRMINNISFKEIVNIRKRIFNTSLN